MDNKIWEVKEKEKICCFDIDGVLMSCYPQCWVDFINSKTGKEFKNLNQAKASVPYDYYRELKREYRTSGIKEMFPADPQASSVTRTLKKLGWTIIIMTARPAHKYPTLYTQTINWLKKNKIFYDSIYFEEDSKHSKILSKIPNIKFMVEDNSYIANQISKWGYKVYLMDTQYNSELDVGENVVRINNLQEVLENE